MSFAAPAQMVAAVHAAAPDPALLRRALAALQKEHAYWTSGAKQVWLCCLGMPARAALWRITVQQAAA